MLPVRISFDNIHNYNYDFIDLVKKITYTYYEQLLIIMIRISIDINKLLRIVRIYL